MSRIIAFAALIILFTINTGTAQTQAQVEKHLNTAISAIKNKNIKIWKSLFPDEAIYLEIIKADGDYSDTTYEDPVLNQISNDITFFRSNRSIYGSFLRMFPKKNEVDIESFFTKWDDLIMIECDFAKDFSRSRDSLHLIIGGGLFQSKANPKQYYIARFEDLVFYKNQVYGMELNVQKADSKEEYLLVKKELAEYSKSDYENPANSYDETDTFSTAEEATAAVAIYEDSMMHTFDRIYKGMIDKDSIELRFIQEPYSFKAYYLNNNSKPIIYLDDIKQIEEGIYRMEDPNKQGYWLVTINEKYVKGIFLKNDKKDSEIALISLQTID